MFKSPHLGAHRSASWLCMYILPLYLEIFSEFSFSTTNLTCHTTFKHGILDNKYYCRVVPCTLKLWLIQDTNLISWKKT